MRTTLALLLIAPLALALSEEARLPGVPTLPEITRTLSDSHATEYQKQVACGFLFLLPDSDTAALEAAYVKRTVGTEAELELVRRGRPVAMEHVIDRILNNTNTEQAYAREQVIARLTREELQPLTRAVVARIKLNPEKRVYSTGALELLTCRSGEKELLSRFLTGTVDHVTKNTASFAPTALTRMLSQDVAPETRALVVEAIRRATPEQKPRLLACVPARNDAFLCDLEFLLSDPTPAIRCAFLGKLQSSNLPQAVEWARRALRDREPSVNQAATHVLLSFRGDLPKEVFDMATGTQGTPFDRATAWRTLQMRKERKPVPQAQQILLRRGEQPALLSAVIGYLQSVGETDWLLSQLPRLEPAVQKEVLSGLMGTAFTDLMPKVSAFIRSNDPRLGASLLQSFAQQSRPESIPFLIELLKDERTEVFTAAEQGLSRQTGLRFTVSEEERRSPRTWSTTLHRRYAQWYERYGSPPSEELNAQMLQVKGLTRQHLKYGLPKLQSLPFDPLTALTRLAADPREGSAALTLLTAWPDPRVNDLLIDLTSDVVFQDRSGELMRALASRPPSARGIEWLRTQYKSAPPATRPALVRALVAWQAGDLLPQLTDDLLVKGVAFEESFGDLLRWSPEPVGTTARGLLNDAKAPEDAARRAARYVAAQCGAQDVKSLLAFAQRAPDVAGPVLESITSLGLDGGQIATDGIAGLLSDGKNPLGDHVLSVLRQRYAKPDESGEFGALPEAWRAALLRRLDVQQKDVAGQTDGLALLAQTADPQSLPAMQNFVAAADEKALSAMSAVLQELTNPAARPCIEMVWTAPKLPHADFGRLASWMKKTGGLSEDIVRQRVLEQQQKHESVLLEQQAVSKGPLQLTLQFKEKLTYDDGRKKTMAVTVRNTGTETLYVLGGNVSLSWRSATQKTAWTPTSRGDFKWTGPKMPEQKNLKGRVAQFYDGTYELRPNGQLQGTLEYEMPTSLPGPSPHFLLVRWEWVSAYNLLAADKRSWEKQEESGKATSKWCELTIVPKLWIEVDRRHGGGLQR